jgi:hypothetical protein
MGQESYDDKEEKFSYPPELQFSLNSLLSLRETIGLHKKRRDYRILNDEKRYPVLRPLHDRGGRVSAYSGPSGPIVTITKIVDNISKGRPAGEGLPPDPLNDPNAP